jgi:hypothetical protein
VHLSCTETSVEVKDKDGWRSHPAGKVYDGWEDR